MSDLRAACFGRDVERDGWPSVSVVVPVRNEADHMERAVSSILAQEYPEPFDVCLAVAPSSDYTWIVAQRLVAASHRVSCVPNPTGVTPAGLNVAIDATQGSILVRVDGHAELSEGYILRAVETMIRTGAVNVGGMQVPRPETMFEEAVAAATTSWMGTGGATYRVGGDEGPVDTVYLGVFDRAAGESIDWFDETLVRNQDYELNIRLRQAGGTVWFDPELSVGYRPRGSWKALAKQYFEYGYWKADVLRRHPESLRMRQLVPVVVTIGCVASVPLATRWRWALLAPVTYVASLGIGTKTHLGRAGALAVMHLTWGCGMVVGALDGTRSGRSSMSPPWNPNHERAAE